MKHLLSLPAPKLIFWICFIPLIMYIICYELYWTKIPSASDTIFKIGIIASKLSYSIIAASIFYFISQYIPIYLPRKQKKIKILPYVHQQVVIIGYNIDLLKSNLNIQQEDFKKSNDFRKILEQINPDNPVAEFENWHQFLFHIKIQILDVIRSIYYYNEYLSTEFLHEIILIEKQLMSPTTFTGYKTLTCPNLSYAEIPIQEILVHNQHLQFLRERESKKYERAFKLAGDAYRQTYYKNKM